MGKKKWNPDKKFLKFMKAELKKEGVIMDKPIIGVGKSLNHNDLLKEMATGTPLGRKFYEAMYKNPHTQKLYKKSLENS